MKSQEFLNFLRLINKLNLFIRNISLKSYSSYERITRSQIERKGLKFGNLIPFSDTYCFNNLGISKKSIGV